MEARPASYKRLQDVKVLVASILRKHNQEKRLKFPHIQGMIYFSFDTVKSQLEKMSFWAWTSFPHSPIENVRVLEEFQDELKRAWFAFVERTTGRKVRHFSVSGSQTVE
jgi:hypothetical protein